MYDGVGGPEFGHGKVLITWRKRPADDKDLSKICHGPVGPVFVEMLVRQRLVSPAQLGQEGWGCGAF